MRPPRLATVLLLGNLTVLALPVAGLQALRLYESALVRQTESELVAQAAVLAGAMRERLQLPPAAGAPGPAAAALHLARRPGLDLATDPVLPPQPEDAPGAPADPALARAGEALTPVLHDAQAVTLSSMRLLDGSGTVVGTTGTDAGRSLAAWPEVAAVLAGAPIAVGMHRRSPAQDVPGGISRTAGLRVFVALPVLGRDARVVGAALLSRTPNTLGSAVWGKLGALAQLACVLLAVGASIAFGVSRLVTRPLRAVVEQARAVAAGGRMRPLARPGTREVASLSRELARMEATLAERAGYVSGLAASVSHEFKTPLAAIAGAAELLEDHADTMTPAERARLLHLVRDGAARLDQLVGGLLGLARADMMRATPALASRTALTPVLDRLAARFPALLVRGAAETPLRIAPAALEAALATLLENASVHAPGAATRLEVHDGPAEVRILVSDDGPGIPRTDADRIFEPFFTTARARGGTGLGLPIARALLAGGGGGITLEDGPGARFRIVLPAA